MTPCSLRHACPGQLKSIAGVLQPAIWKSGSYVQAVIEGNGPAGCRMLYLRVLRCVGAIGVGAPGIRSCKVGRRRPTGPHRQSPRRRHLISRYCPLDLDLLIVQRLHVRQKRAGGSGWPALHIACASTGWCCPSCTLCHLAVAGAVLLLARQGSRLRGSCRHGRWPQALSPATDRPAALHRQTPPQQR